MCVCVRVWRHRYVERPLYTDIFPHNRVLNWARYLNSCLIVFMSDHQTFCNLFNNRRHDIGCINHDIVVGLCSELLMRLSYVIHQGF